LFRHHYNLKATIARFYNVYGPHHLTTGDYCTLIGSWENRLKNKLPLIIYGDGSKKRDFTHVTDIVDALYLIYLKNAWGYVFELGRGKNYSIAEIAVMFKHEVQYLDNKIGEAEITLCTDSTANTILGWNPILDIESYIQNFLHENIL
jgi:UDP-glucose 4-epimerase